MRAVLGAAQWNVIPVNVVRHSSIATDVLFTEY